MSRRRWLWTASGAFAITAVIVVLLLSGSGSRRPTPLASRPSTPTTPSAPTAPTTTAPPPPAPPPQRQTPSPPAPATEVFGASVNLLFNPPAVAPHEIRTQLDGLKAAGATTARSDALWEASEPVAPAGGIHRYDWTFDDRIAGDLARHRLRWLAILDYTVTWAQSVTGQDHSPPRSDADYAAYARAFATRYGANGTFWRAHPGLPSEPVDTYEIWNEPDSKVFWVPTPDAPRYADLYMAARAAIDAAQPTARVIVGGLTKPTVFLPAMIFARPQLRGHIDGVGLHPYGGNPFDVLEGVKAARHTLKSLGMARVPVYVTEFGWSTKPAGNPHFASAQIRPGYISATLAALGHLDCGVAAGVVYTWYSPQQNPADAEQWFGLGGPGAGVTPSTQALALGVRRANAGGQTLRLCR